MFTTVWSNFFDVLMYSIRQSARISTQEERFYIKMTSETHKSQILWSPHSTESKDRAIVMLQVQLSPESCLQLHSCTQPFLCHHIHAGTSLNWRIFQFQSIQMTGKQSTVRQDFTQPFTAKLYQSLTHLDSEYQHRTTLEIHPLISLYWSTALHWHQIESMRQIGISHMLLIPAVLQRVLMHRGTLQT